MSENGHYLKAKILHFLKKVKVFEKLILLQKTPNNFPFFRFPNKNVNKYPDKSARMYPNRIANLLKDKNARMYPDNNAHK